MHLWEKKQKTPCALRSLLLCLSEETPDLVQVFPATLVPSFFPRQHGTDTIPVLPRGPHPPKPSVFVTVFAVRVAVGKTGIARPQRPQELCELCSRLVDALVIGEAVGTALQEAVYLVLHRLQEFPLQQLRQKLLTHHDEAVLLSDGVTGHKGGLAVHSQTAKYIFVLLLAVSQLAPCYRQLNQLLEAQ